MCARVGMGEAYVNFEPMLDGATKLSPIHSELKTQNLSNPQNRPKTQRQPTLRLWAGHPTRSSDRKG